MSLWKAEQFRSDGDEKAQEAPAKTAAPEWFDHHPWVPIIFLILLPFLVELPLFIFGLSINPIWQQSWITAAVQPGPLPGLSYGDPNFGWTTQALGHLAAQDWMHGIIPWWNPYSGIGLPLAGEMQPNAFFLPFVFWLLLPNGVLWLKITMEIMAGLATFALIRELGLSRTSALFAAILFEMNGTFSWTPGPIAVLNVIAFLPLLLYGVEKSRKQDQSALGIFWIAMAIAGSLYAGFPEEAYINGIFALAWAIYRYVVDGWRWRFLLRVSAGGVLGLLFAAPILVAFIDYLMNSTALGAHQLGHAFLPLQAFSTIFMPYLYGPSADSHGSSFISGIWGGTGGYLGILLIFIAIYGLAGKRERGLKIILAGWIVIALAKSFGIQPVIAIMNHIPLLVDAAFFRYSPPSWEFAVIMLAAFALEDLRFRARSIVWPTLLCAGLLGFSVYANWPWQPLDHWSPELIHKLKILFIVNWGATLLGLVVLILAWKFMHGEKRRRLLAALIALNASALYMIPELSAVKPGHVDESAIRFLKNHVGTNRFFTLDPIAPNYAAYFNIPSLNYNYLPIATNWEHYVARNLFPDLTKSTGVIFWPAWYPGNTTQTILNRIHAYEKVGVRYLITDSGQSLVPSATIPAGKASNTPLPLLAGQSAEIAFAVPTGWKSKESVNGVGIFQGNYGNTANGNLAIKICSAAHGCVAGSRPLSESRDNSVFSIPLAHSLRVEPGEALTITLSHVGGNRPEALWLWPQAPGYAQRITGPQGPLSGKALQLSLEYGGTATGVRKVYSGALMDIWELPHPAPYYTILHGDCSLTEQTRETVVAQCHTPSTLLRRELYMPGWSATVNGSNMAVSAHEEIFQTIPLGAGKNMVRFHFAPPYSDYAWVAFLLGLAGLLWQGYQALFIPRFRNQETGKEAL
ncbi:MAG: YfhO family protein [Acidithiobacillus sp.]|nr:YfhO family protein [Acidithiobacillus sp.]